MVDVDNGEIIEFVNDGIEELQKQIAIDHGYELVHHELVLTSKEAGLNPQAQPTPYRAVNVCAD